jgi:hypothetical protein
LSVYRYREDVLAELWKYGVRPTERTPPELVRGFIRDLYRFEIRKLRDRYVRTEFSKREYFDKVVELRDRYPVLALVAREWVQPT